MLVLQITTAFIYQALSTAMGNSQKFSVDQTQNLRFSTYFRYYSIFFYPVRFRYNTASTPEAAELLHSISACAWQPYMDVCHFY